MDTQKENFSSFNTFMSNALQQIKNVLEAKSAPGDSASLVRDSGVDYLGCYADSPNRALPILLRSVSNVGDCIAQGRAGNHRDIGLQFGGECWGSGTGARIGNYAKHGLKNDYSRCIQPLGADWMNHVYRLRNTQGDIDEMNEKERREKERQELIALFNKIFNDFTVIYNITIAQKSIITNVMNQVKTFTDNAKTNRTNSESSLTSAQSSLSSANTNIVKLEELINAAKQLESKSGTSLSDSANINNAIGNANNALNSISLVNQNISNFNSAIISVSNSQKSTLSAYNSLLNIKLTAFNAYTLSHDRYYSYVNNANNQTNRREVLDNKPISDLKKNIIKTIDESNTMIASIDNSIKLSLVELNLASTALTTSNNLKIDSIIERITTVQKNANLVVTNANNKNTQIAVALAARNKLNEEAAAERARLAKLAKERADLQLKTENLQNSIMKKLSLDAKNLNDVTTLKDITTSIEAFTNQKAITFPKNNNQELNNYASAFNASVALLDDPNQMNKVAFDTYIYMQNRKIANLNKNIENIRNNINTEIVPPPVKSIRSMNNSQILNVEEYPAAPYNTIPNVIDTYNGNNGSFRKNYLIYGNNGCIQYEPNSDNDNNAPTWDFKPCNSNEKKQQFIINKINDLEQYNNPINDNNKNYRIKNATNVKFGFNTVSPDIDSSQCLQLNNDGLSVMPCTMQSSQKFSTSYHSVL